jgi:hypothetical protein
MFVVIESTILYSVAYTLLPRDTFKEKGAWSCAGYITYPQQSLSMKY